jgi:hypothetical protein
MRKEQKKRSDRQPNGENPSRLEFALPAAERGWAVLPLQWIENGECSCSTPHCSHAGKHPRIEHGVHDSTTDEKKIRAWWRENPKANIGIAAGATSGLLVLDVDPRHKGDKSLSDAENIHGQLPIGPRSRSGGGGEHIYLLHPPGEPLKSRVNLLPGIDVRGGRNLRRRRG